MAIANLNNITAYYASWGSNNWSSAIKRDYQDGDSASFYTGYRKSSTGGGEYYWRSKLAITIDSNLTLSIVNKLVLKLKADGSAKAKYLRAFLSETNYSNANPENCVKGYLSKSYFYKNESKTRLDTSTPSGSEVFLVFEGIDGKIKAGTTYYIYIFPYENDSQADTTKFYGGWFKSRNYSSYLTASLNYESYSKCTPPITVTAAATGHRGKPIFLTWSGAMVGQGGNDIIGYRVYYAKNEMPNLDTDNYNYVEASDLSGQFLFYNTNDVQRGDRIFFAVQSIGKIEGYDSILSLPQTAVTLILNSPPQISTSLDIEGPNFLSGLRDDLVEITISDFRVSDPDEGDLVQYFYQLLNAVPETHPIEGWNLIEDEAESFSVNVNRNSNIIGIKATDGYESSYSYQIIKVNTPPAVKEIGIKGEDFSMLNITDCFATRTLEISSKFNKITNASIFLSFDEGDYLLDRFETSNGIGSVRSIETCPNQYRGKRFNIKLVLFDGIDTVESIYETNYYYMAAMPKILNFNVQHLENEFTGNDQSDSPIFIQVGNNKIGKKISISFEIEQMLNSSISLNKAEIYAQSGNAIQVLETINNISNNTASSIAFQRELLVIDLDQDLNYQFGVRLIENGPQRVRNEVSPTYYSFLKKPVFTTIPRVNPLNWNIYKNSESEDFIIAVQDLDTSETGANTYSLWADFNNQKKEILSFNRYTATTVLQDTLFYNITPDKYWELFKKFGIPSNSTNVAVKYSIRVSNGAKVFSNEIETLDRNDSNSYQIITRAETKWNNHFVVSRGYSSNKDIPIDNFITIDATTAEREKIINPLECLKFNFTSLPQNDGQLYFDGEKESSLGMEFFEKIDIEYALSTEDPSNKQDSERLSFYEELKWANLGATAINPSALEEHHEENSYYYYLTLPRLSEQSRAEGKYLFFRATAYVKNGNKFQSKTITMDTYSKPLIYGRVTQPKFKLELRPNENGQIELKDNKLFFGLNLTDPDLDYGGLNKSYDNFLREDSNGKYKLTINYGAVLSNLNYSVDFTIPPEEITNSFTWDLDSKADIGSKIFYQATLKLYPNSSDNGFSSVLTQNEADLFYLGGPTVQFRKHAVGINTEDSLFEKVPRGALMVSSYEDRDLVLFKHSLDDKGIVIDLKSKRIYGADIDCGGW